MNFIESFNNKTILIPLLQRDYVQGKESAVISPFLDSLLEKDCDLNYIYGYQEEGCFIPVDGQQRLTTLWLLYLYLFARKGQIAKYNIELKFASREYANDFCERIKEHLTELLSKSSSYRSLDEAIIDQNWFIRSWCKNVTVSSMLGTLKHIHRKINKTDFLYVWKRLVEGDEPSVTFAFLQMDESKGLDDDIYIKMNGRGRKLSAFENLKSWMDEKISSRPYAEQWRAEMDNAWTDLFWQNRNQQQEHPEEIDDEQLHFFYNLLILYHIKDGTLLRTIVRMRESEPYQLEELQDFFGVDAKADDWTIVDKIVDKLQKAGNMPLLWLERLGLAPDGFFDFAFTSTRAIVERSKSLNDSNLYLGGNQIGKTTLTYHISMCEGSIDRTLPLFYALLSYKGGKTSLYDWMRVMRNLVLNTTISRDNLHALIKVMDSFGEQCSTENIYALLRNPGTKEALKGFNATQVGEEMLKANQMDFYDQMVALENGRFFSGHIGVLFRMLDQNPSNCQDYLNKENAEAYTNVLLSLFDGKDGGCSANYDDSSHMLRRALMTFRPYYFGVQKNGCWSFCHGLEEWREYVDTKDDCRCALFALMKEVLVPSYKYGQCLEAALAEHVETVSANYEHSLTNVDDDSFRHHFIHHPEVWEYMRTKRCMWSDNNFDIELKTSNGNNSDRMELRTYSLYLDYRHNDDFKAEREGWKIGIWGKWKSCFYFEKEIEAERNKSKAAIDVYFYNQEQRRTNEDNYAFDLFIRSNHPAPLSKEEELKYAEEDYQANAQLFGRLIPTLMGSFRRKEDGRLCSTTLYSRSGIRKILREIMQGINNAVAATWSEEGVEQS